MSWTGSQSLPHILTNSLFTIRAKICRYTAWVTISFVKETTNVTDYIRNTLQRRIYRTAQAGLDPLSQDCSNIRNCTSVNDQQTNQQIACLGHSHSSEAISRRENPEITHLWVVCILRSWHTSDYINALLISNYMHLQLTSKYCMISCYTLCYTFRLKKDVFRENQVLTKNLT